MSVRTKNCDPGIISKKYTEPMPSISDKGLTLFLFEGKETEDNLIRNLERNFLGDTHAIKCVYDTDIYQLYRSITQEETVFQQDIVTLLKDRPLTKKILEQYNRDSFAYVYLFFDYDGHATMASDDKIIEMLSFFNNETENGKLYISYPMVEAIRHYVDIDSFKDLTVKCKGRNCPYLDDCTDKDACLKEPHYKQIVADNSKPGLSNMNYKQAVWKELIMAHLCKMNALVNDIFTFPQDICLQSEIFSKQLEKHINQKCPQVTVLSALPIYVLDYYGCKKLQARLGL